MDLPQLTVVADTPRWSVPKAKYDRFLIESDHFGRLRGLMAVPCRVLRDGGALGCDRRQRVNGAVLARATSSMGSWILSISPEPS